MTSTFNQETNNITHSSDEKSVNYNLNLPKETSKTENTEKIEKSSENPKKTAKTIEELAQQILILKNKLLKPQIITLQGIENLPAEPGRDWREKVFDLFYSARLPMFWILDLELDETEETQTVIHISLINFAIKEHVNKILTQYLNTEYSNNIYIS